MHYSGGGGGGVLCHGTLAVIGTMSDMVSNSLKSQKSFVSIETWKCPTNFLVSRYTSVLKILIWQDGDVSGTKVRKFYRCVLDKSGRTRMKLPSLYTENFVGKGGCFLLG